MRKWVSDKHVRNELCYKKKHVIPRTPIMTPTTGFLSSSEFSNRAEIFKRVLINCIAKNNEDKEFKLRLSLNAV